MLHRRFLLKVRKHHKYRQSKEAGLDASTNILSFQGFIHQFASPGGPLALDRWLLSSLSMYSFSLAAMIIHMDSMNSLEDPNTSDFAGTRAGVAALEESCKNWIRS